MAVLLFEIKPRFYVRFAQISFSIWNKKKICECRYFTHMSKTLARLHHLTKKGGGAGCNKICLTKGRIET